MGSYIGRRLLYCIPVIILVSIMAFSLLHLSGGDPAAMMLGDGADPAVIARVRTELGLDKPLYEQYWTWLSKAAQGDLGRSILPSRLRVGEAIVQRAPFTLELVCCASCSPLVIGLPIGILAGVRAGFTRFDIIASNIAILGIAIPEFPARPAADPGGLPLVALAASLGRIRRPRSGPRSELPSDGPAVHHPRPLFWLAFIVRITRVSIHRGPAARVHHHRPSKGSAGRGVVLRHAMRPAPMPVVTIIGLQPGAVLGGSIIIEAIFALPGLGKLTIHGGFTAATFPCCRARSVLSIGFVLVNIAVDVAYAYLDPRIRYG